MSRKQKNFDPKRNHIFAAAIDELRRREGKKLSQKEIADRMGVTEDTISRIMRLHNQVTEDIITRLQTASGCIFNLQWLRGESDVMLAADVDNKPAPAADNLHESTHIDQSSLMNATIAAKDEAIESLKRELAAKDTLIETLKEQVSDLRAAIEQNKKGNYGNYPFTPGVADEGRKTQV